MSNEIRMIPSFRAAELANAYHDAMNMVSSRSTLDIAVGKTPRSVLAAYLKACENTGLKLHNDHWLAYAEKVVEELEEKRAKVWRDIFYKR